MPFKPAQSDMVTSEAKQQPRCDFNPPSPVLVAARYTDYHDRAIVGQANATP